MTTIPQGGRGTARVSLAAFAACCLLAAGCGGSSGLVPVKGKVTFKNKPLAGMTVYFVPDPAGSGGRQQATGYTAADGSFNLTTAGSSGAQAGRYRIMVVAEMIPDRALIKYANVKTSPLPPVEVPAAGLKDYELILK